MNYSDRGHWALNTTKNCPKLEYLPIIQQFKKYYPKEKNKITKSFLSKDILTIKTPKKKDILTNYSFLEEKNKFGIHYVLKNEWKPKINKSSVMNYSYVDYNIVSHGKNPFYEKPKLLDKTIYNKQKGLGNFQEEKSPYSNHICNEYLNVFKSNPNIFKKYNGIFSHIYDVSHRDGHIYYPFELKSIKK